MVDANNDAVITNFLPGTSFQVPKWVLLLNDVDPDNTIDITGVSGPAGLTAALGASSVTVTDTGAPSGTFVYTATGGAATNNATVTVSTNNSVVSLNETFTSTNYGLDDGAWEDDWVEIGDDGSPTSDNGQIRIFNGRLEFDVGTDAASSNGAMIQRAANMARPRLRRARSSIVLNHAVGSSFMSAPRISTRLSMSSHHCRASKSICAKGRR